MLSFGLAGGRASPGISAYPAFCGSNEFEESRRGRASEFFSCRGNRRAQLLTAAKQEMIESPQLQPLFAGKPRTPQSNSVQSADAIVSARNGERGQIFADGRTALHEGQGPDASELMHEAIAGDERTVLDCHVSR